MSYARHQFFVQDGAGNVMPNASVRVEQEALGFPLATIYGDIDGASPLGNPILSDSNGYVFFHAAGGQYRVTVTKGTFSQEFRYVQVGVAAGADGATPGLKFTYSTTTTDADPGNGIFRLNNATLSSVTAAYVDNLDNSGATVSAYLDTLDDTGDSSNRGVLQLRCLSDQSKFAVYKVTGSVVDGTGYRKLTLQHIASNGPLTGSTVFGFAPSGAAGTNGITVATLQTYDSTTADADPGNGTFRLNNATLASVTAAYLDNLDSAGVTVTGWLDTFDDGGNSGNRGTLTVRQLTDTSKFARYTVSGSVVDGTGYRKLTLTHQASNGPLSGVCAIEFVATGASGAGTGDVVGPASATNNAIALFDLTTGKLLKDSAVTISTDGTLTSNSDAKVATEKAVKTYVNGILDALDGLQYKGVIDCSANPNYPAASAGHLYVVSGAGKIGGASGVTVEVGDTILCKTDATASGNHATVGAQWNVLQANITGGGGSVTTTYPLSGTSSLTYVGPLNQGRLAYVSSTAIKFSPYDGDLIRINGVVYQIPSAGIAGVANTNVYVNGVAAQNLAASTLYYVYAFNNSGTITADFSTTGHATSTTSGNVGTEIKSGDDTRTLIGMVRTNGSSQFVDSTTQRFVLSWFNQKALSTTNFFTANRTTTSASFVELNSEIRNEFLVWSGNPVSASFSGGCTISATDTAYIAIGYNGTTPDGGSAILNGTGAPTVIGGAGASSNTNALVEGYNYATVIATIAGGNTLTVTGTANAGKRSGLTCTTRG